MLVVICSRFWKVWFGWVMFRCFGWMLRVIGLLVVSLLVYSGRLMCVLYLRVIL